MLLTATFLTISSFAQDKHLIDSLEITYKTHNARKMELMIQSPSLYDTTAVNILNQIATAYFGNYPDTAIDLANQSLAISEQIGYKKGVGNAYNIMGIAKTIKGDFLPALEFHKKALKIRQEIGVRKGIASSYNNIGIIFNRQGNTAEALKNYFASMKILEEIGDKSGVANSYNNIGIIYRNQGNYPEALKNYFASLKINEDLVDSKGIAYCYNNIGTVYNNLGNYPVALKNFIASLQILEEIGDRRGMAAAYVNIGSNYEYQRNYPEALKNYFASLKIEEEDGDKTGIALAYSNIGHIYSNEKKFVESSQFLNKGLSLAKEIGSLDLIVECYANLVNLDSAQGNFERALEYYKLYIAYRDSIENTENTKKAVALQMNYDFGKQQDSLNLVQASKDILAQKELQKQKFVRNGFVFGTILLLLLAGAIYVGLRKTGKAKKKSEELLLNILPFEVAEEIKTTGTAKAKAFTQVTVMFADFKDFTLVSEKVNAELLVDEIHTCFSAFDNIIEKHRIEKIKTIGDAYLCASGLPISSYTHAVDMLNAAFEIRNFMLKRKKEKEELGEIPFEVRIGIHTGPVVAGIVGVKKYAYDIWGDTVNLAARLEQSSEAGKVNISGSTYELVKDKFLCTHRGKIHAKNKGEIDMYFVEINS